MKVTIKTKAHIDIKKLMKQYPDIEWFGLLYGKKYKNKININKIHIPEMENQSSSWVETTYMLIEPKIGKYEFVGYIHSHHNMKAYFSREDLKQFDQIKFSMVVSHNNIVAKYKENNQIKNIKSIEMEEIN